jgi:hypothetical protein
MRSDFRLCFTNITGCAVGISEISWFVTVTAESEAEAIELAIEQARIVNCETGFPPHGTRVSESELRRLACVLPGNNRGESN